MRYFLVTKGTPPRPLLLFTVQSCRVVEEVFHVIYLANLLLQKIVQQFLMLRSEDVVAPIAVAALAYPTVSRNRSRRAVALRRCLCHCTNLSLLTQHRVSVKKHPIALLRQKANRVLENYGRRFSDVRVFEFGELEWVLI